MKRPAHEAKDKQQEFIVIYLHIITIDDDLHEQEQMNKTR